MKKKNSYLFQKYGTHLWICNQCKAGLGSITKFDYNYDFDYRSRKTLDYKYDYLIFFSSAYDYDFNYTPIISFITIMIICPLTDQLRFWLEVADYNYDYDYKNENNKEINTYFISETRSVKIKMIY